ncbi:heat stress transcription factor B-3-like [Vigna radiata var. radiata]|uniref:Heat stress transcription factor B-3-like n=1 Tax=Vigna radiata var. radiata TaxID=3916 RepID=A0A1S3UZ93_VIGRR|nr:heat stress transcription factor B-3-like [Vigna radiata var. radiata]
MEEETEKGLLECVRKFSTAPFLLKTYMLVEDPTTNDVVSWNDDGTTFVVLQPAEFARDLLPTLFNHCNFSSFVRQLNTYGFRKVRRSRWEFCNERFRKGEKELLCEMRRKKSWVRKKQNERSLASRFSSNYAVLMDENKRLKKENKVLQSELTTIKTKCRDLLDLVTKYSSAKPERLRFEQVQEES